MPYFFKTNSTPKENASFHQLVFLKNKSVGFIPKFSTVIIHTGTSLTTFSSKKGHKNMNGFQSIFGNKTVIQNIQTLCTEKGHF
jgi:hypothetical protein